MNLMNITNILRTGVLATLAFAAINATATGIDENAARNAAMSFLQRNKTAAFKAPSTTAVRLAHAEAMAAGGNAYYVFNIDGGGWVIIAGDDRANSVLAYNDKGSIDMNNLPDNMKGYMNMYKNQIEFMKDYKGEVVPLKTANRREPIGPLMKTDWAQGNPFNLQCPMLSDGLSIVGCAGLAMAQILNYWEYPKECSGLPSYRNEYTASYLPSLPATTFDYDLILDHYSIWRNDTLFLLRTTQEEKDEVAKLCRYASQSCRMNFSPDGSGSTVTKQKHGFVEMGFSDNAKIVGIYAWPTRETWNTEDYSHEDWVALMTAQLEAHHPIPYSVENDDGHAFVIDGIDADGLFHINWGWYGKCDGWFQYGAFDVTPSGTTLHYNDYAFMIIDLYPYEGYVSPNDPSGGDIMYGDLNDDGVINITDVTMLVNIVMSENPDSTSVPAADFDQNGVVNITDVTMLINYVMSLAE